MARALLICVGGMFLGGVLLQALLAGDKTPAAIPAGGENPAAIQELEKTLKATRQHMVRVTAEPFHVAPPRKVPRQPAAACLPAFIGNDKVTAVVRNPHEGHWIHVFITPGGRDPITSGTAEYPEGTIILKQKLKDAAGKRTEFYTGMLKREPGFARDVGDWEFFTTDASGRKVMSRGQEKNCAECHQKFKDTGFVSRKYLEKKTKTGGNPTNRALDDN